MKQLLNFSFLMILVCPGMAMASVTAAKYVPNQVLVRFKPAVSVADRNSQIHQSGMKILGNIYRIPGQAEILKLRTASGESVEQAIERLGKNTNVDFAEPDYILYQSATPNDTYYQYLWAQKNTAQSLIWTTTNALAGPDLSRELGVPGVVGNDMGMEEAWNKRTDCASTVVAVVDSGIKWDHEDLSQNMWISSNGTIANHGWDFANNDNDPMDDNGHGTHVAGTIAARGNNNKGVAGVCWTANLMAVKVFGTSGGGSTSTVASGINFAVDNGAKIINLSLGGSLGGIALATAVASAGSSDVVVVSAAGNDGTSNDSLPQYPCEYAKTKSNSICVAATYQDGTKAGFSNHGVNSVQIAAPGSNILSTWYASRSNGTISASSFVTSTNTATAWGTAAVFSGIGLTIPSPWNGTSLQYANGTDALATLTIDNTMADSIWIRYAYNMNIGTGDVLRVYANSGTMSVTSGGTLGTYNTVDGSNSYSTAPKDASTWCRQSVCQIGLRLLTDGSVQSYGAAIGNLSMVRFAPGTTGYNIISGTSMAAPQVAGIAALLRAQNPSYTAPDVIKALKGGGRTVAGLASVVSTGKTADAVGALSFIAPPTGLSAVQAP